MLLKKNSKHQQLVAFGRWRGKNNNTTLARMCSRLSTSNKEEGKEEVLDVH